MDGLSPLPVVPPDPSNKYADDPHAATLGQRLFFDPGYSGALVVGNDGQNGALGAVGQSGKVSCASCHVPAATFQDNRSNPSLTSLGVDWTKRNTPSIINATFYNWYFWDGRADAMWVQAQGPSEAPREMGGDRLKIAHMIFTKYRADYEAIFGPLDLALDPASPMAARFPASAIPKATASSPNGAWEKMTPADQDAASTIFVNFGKALEAYERLLVSRNSPFDRYVAGDHTALSASAKRGLKLFIGKAACSACHNTPLLSDNDFHVTGVHQGGPHIPAEDLGRSAGIDQVLGNPLNTGSKFSDGKSPADLTTVRDGTDRTGAFRTKHLREVAQTGPYMHDGQLATLADVVDFYNRGGETTGFAGQKDPRMVPLNLTPEEQADLVSFLEALTGEPVPAPLLVDTSRASL